MIAIPLDTVGFIAGTLTTVSFVPQVVHILRVKRADDLSWWAFGTFTVGVVMWLTYGVMLGAAPIIVANLVMVVLAVAILLLKWRYRAERASPRPPRETN